MDAGIADESGGGASGGDYGVWFSPCVSSGRDERVVDCLATSCAVLGFLARACAGGRDFDGEFLVEVVSQRLDILCEGGVAIIPCAGVVEFSLLDAGRLRGYDPFVPSVSQCRDVCCVGGSASLDDAGAQDHSDRFAGRRRDGVSLTPFVAFRRNLRHVVHRRASCTMPGLAARLGASRESICDEFLYEVMSQRLYFLLFDFAASVHGAAIFFYSDCFAGRFSLDASVVPAMSVGRDDPDVGYSVA